MNSHIESRLGPQPLESIIRPRKVHDERCTGNDAVLEGLKYGVRRGAAQSHVIRSDDEALRHYDFTFCTMSGILPPARTIGSGASSELTRIVLPSSFWSLSWTRLSSSEARPLLATARITTRSRSS